jgi:mRNA interferase MazF
MQIFRGDIFYIENNYHNDGATISGSRPAIIVSNNLCNKHSDFVEVVYLTSKERKPMPTHVNVICKVPSTAMCEQIASVNKNRLGDFVRSCTQDEMKEIDKALMVSLGLDDPVEAYAPKFSYSESKALEDAENKIKILTTVKNSMEGIIKENNEDLRKLEAENKVLKELYDQLLEKMVG